MKKAAYIATVAFIIILFSCSKEDAPPELLLAENVQATLLGKWSIDNIDYNVCRDNNCNFTNYKGQQQDYVEFKVDSVFIRYSNSQHQIIKKGFKADYSLSGGFILSNGQWSGKFKIQKLKEGKLVLENSFTGLDPKVIFTDVYYLYR